jgi:hypothetical protein
MNHVGIVVVSVISFIETEVDARSVIATRVLIIKASSSVKVVNREVVAEHAARAGFHNMWRSDGVEYIVFDQSIATGIALNTVANYDVILRKEEIAISHGDTGRILQSDMRFGGVNPTNTLDPTVQTIEYPNSYCLRIAGRIYREIL